MTNTPKLKQFDLRVGDTVIAKDRDKITDLQGDKRPTPKSRYRVIAIYKHIFVAQKIRGSKRQIGFSKVDYRIGEVEKVEEDEL